MKVNESEVTFMREAEIKTYPTDKFTQQFIKDICSIFGYERCICNGTVSDDSEILRYDGKHIFIDEYHDNPFEIHSVEDMKAIAMIKPTYDYIENNIAGTVWYDVQLNSLDYDTIPSKNKKFVDVNLAKNMLTSNKLSMLIQHAYTYGYSYVQHSIHTMNSATPVFSIGFEAKFHDVEFLLNDKLYHLAPMSLKDKILKTGISPKSKSFNNGTQLNHPDRVYMFNLYDKSIFATFVSLHDKKSKIFDKSNRILFQTNEFALFEIDFQMLKKRKDIQIYRDDMFQSYDDKKPTAVFTYSNIPPDVISFKEKLIRNNKI